MLIHALDDRPFDRYGAELCSAARVRGHDARLFRSAEQVREPGYVFARLCQNQPRLDYDRAQWRTLEQQGRHKFIQDPGQIAAYEDKGYQTGLWSKFMPETRLLFSRSAAQMHAMALCLPVVSKSFIGSASHNVRVLRHPDGVQREIGAAFGEGIKITGGVQKGYVLWQEYIPHSTTFRVTAVGNERHIYQRFNYVDRGVAAPAKVIPTKPMPMSDEAESLLEFCNDFFLTAGTKWCAIDVLKDPRGGWKLLETALGWARGNDESGNAKFYGTKWSLNTQHEMLLDEMEAGVFG